MIERIRVRTIVENFWNCSWMFSRQQIQWRYSRNHCPCVLWGPIQQNLTHLFTLKSGIAGFVDLWCNIVKGFRIMWDLPIEKGQTTSTQVFIELAPCQHCSLSAFFKSSFSRNFIYLPFWGCFLFHISIKNFKLVTMDIPDTKMFPTQNFIKFEKLQNLDSNQILKCLEKSSWAVSKVSSVSIVNP